MRWPPAAAVTHVRAALDEAGYDEPSLRGLLGAPDPVLTADEQTSLWTWRARGPQPLAVLARLFLLQRPVSLRRARPALGALAPWEALGLLSARDGVVRARVEVAVHRGLRITSQVPDPRRPGRDVVLGVTTASLLLDHMRWPQRGGDVLDLGTGTGFLALRMAGGATTVTGTDLSPAAVRTAQLNAALNGFSNTRFLRSDRFAALGRRAFHLVLGNLPFVISPQKRFVFRDAGMALDGFLGSVVSRVGRHLREGGHAQLLGQWVHRRGQSEDARLAPWVVAAGCDALILRLETEAVDRYAARWLAGPATSLPMDTRMARLRAWMRSYEQAGVLAISTGVFLLRKRTGGRHVFEVDEVQDAGSAPDGPGLARRFRALGKRAGLW